MEKIFRERLNYIVTENCIVGTTVNLPLVCQADTIEELQRRMKIMAKSYIKHLSETFELNDPFELKELSEPEWRALK